MKQAILTSIGSIMVKEVEQREIAPGEVLIELEVCGLCGSDLHIFEGDHPVIGPPTVMGHEFSGRVIQVGSHVKSLQLGDYVAGIPGVGCGICEHCTMGNFNLCHELKVIGGHIPGAFAEFIIVPEENLIKIPEQFTATEGAMVESLAVAVHAVHHFSKVEGQTFAVLGAGPIGLLTLQVLKVFGAKNVIVSDPNKIRRHLSKELDADVSVDPLQEDLHEKVIKTVGLMGLDGAVDCAGSEKTLHQALSITKNGGEIVIAAIFGESPKLPMRLLQRGERKLYGTQMYRKEDFEIAIKLIETKKVNINALITHRFEINQIHDAFMLASSRASDVGKILIDIKKV
ncbi:alcohol dehydrogenase catalytic domain-containing protein [bacterium LRH843]|nr:alcohol dehydrogenase catalytic domain-containing protein [bacterium LRH843]